MTPSRLQSSHKIGEDGSKSTDPPSLMSLLKIKSPDSALIFQQLPPQSIFTFNNYAGLLHFVRTS